MLNITDLNIAFKRQATLVNAVDDVSFTINAGETVALVGESGSGKSLTSLALMRLLPENAMFGLSSKVELTGEELLDLPESLMRAIRGRRVSMIFQEPMTALNPVLTVGQQLIECVRRSHELSTQHERDEVMLQLLHDVEIPQPEVRINYYPHQLSGGQKQRVVIAMALAGKPELLIADEPTTALDVTVQKQILSLLKKIQIKNNMSMLLITHDLAIVKYMAARVYVMYAGQLVESALVSDFFQQPLHPYSQQLLASLPTFAARLDLLSVIPGRVPTLGAYPAGCRFHPRCAHAYSPCSTLAPDYITTGGTRSVRCHLYPEHSKPPKLLNKERPLQRTLLEDEVILSAQALSVYFRHNKGPIHKAVDNITFELHKGRTLALVGESGCGKSTVCRTLLGLQPITHGEILFKGISIARMRGRVLKSFRKNIQIIFQDPYSSMNPRMTIGSIISEGMEAQGYSRARIRSRLWELIHQVNLPETCLSQYPHQFSGGQRQRICIARALATSPEVLICDEPTSALDISVQAQILNLLKSLQSELQLSYLFITHNLGVVSYLADDVLVMHEGTIVERGSCEQILNAPQHEYTKELLAGVLTI